MNALVFVLLLLLLLEKGRVGRFGEIGQGEKGALDIVCCLILQGNSNVERPYIARNEREISHLLRLLIAS